MTITVFSLIKVLDVSYPIKCQRCQLLLIKHLSSFVLCTPKMIESRRYRLSLSALWYLTLPFPGRITSSELCHGPQWNVITSIIYYIRYNTSWRRMNQKKKYEWNISVYHTGIYRYSIGRTRYSTRTWYLSGFIELRLSGQSVPFTTIELACRFSFHLVGVSGISVLEAGENVKKKQLQPRFSPYVITIIIKWEKKKNHVNLWQIF